MGTTLPPRIKAAFDRKSAMSEPTDVIIPVYNGPNYIVESCVNSVIAAVPQNDYHVIVIDDDSTDSYIINYLKSKSTSGEIELLNNQRNLGFVRTVNRGMTINKKRDVILLNSDTIVYGQWAERMRRGAYSSDKIATVNPLSNGWISNYPTFGRTDCGNYLEVSDENLNDLCLEVNYGRVVQVPGTIGFCMFIKRRCIEEVGLFDYHNFPEGYGDETDFCYRATAVGWTHAVVGDVFVRHWENQSFTSERKQKLLTDAAKKFQVLHPNHAKIMENFVRMDPQRTLRANLDLARLKRRFEVCKQLPVVFSNNIKRRQLATPPLFLSYRQEQRCLQLNLIEGNEKFPNLELYRVPRDIARINTMMSYLGVEELLFSSRLELREFEQQISSFPVDIKFKAELKMNIGIGSGSIPLESDAGWSRGNDACSSTPILGPAHQGKIVERERALPAQTPTPCCVGEGNRASSRMQKALGPGGAVNIESGQNCVAKVDVIVPVYNQAEYVENLLASLCVSHNVTPAEIIVIDDCSTEESTIDVLKSYVERGAITLLKNQENMGFTRTVNRGMAWHRDRDVVLLNSDTAVHGDWLDRMAACAYSEPNIATVNPLTSQYGSHISCYPGLAEKFDGDLELSGQELSEICAYFNHRHYVGVHTTVGFCMYIRRQSLDSIGYFDAKSFPTAYGEESDFCHRARKVGWRHLIAGDAYVEHFNGKSFGESTHSLKEHMVAAFSRLHPDGVYCDQRFVRLDPLRTLRKQVDFGRLKRLLRGANEIRVVMAGEKSDNNENVGLILDGENKKLTFASVLGDESLPNIGSFRLPKDVASLNQALRLLAIDCLNFKDKLALELFRSLVAGKPYEIRFAAQIQLKGLADSESVGR